MLNKISNGEEVPKKIKKTWVYEWSFDEVRDDFSYITKNGCRFDSDWLVLDMLDDEVEIIEEDKKISKLDFVEENTFSKRQNGMTSEDRRLLDSNFRELGTKINEIIDKLNEMEKNNV